MATISNPEAANRRARVIASDILTYNPEKAVKGIEDDNLFDILAEMIDEGHEHYKAEVAPELYDSTNFYYRAIVDVLLGYQAHVKSKIW
ncbi:MAG: hypothetical protein IPK13_26715 [Deltaproteobacteria bacterium]|nr:hypothetical protein [Deltaproteobacteria bacterium]